MKNRILKKIIGVLLALIMLVSVIPASVIGVLADYEDGMECWFCNHYHWDEYCCGTCGACSEECTNGGCYLSTHCSECGACDKLADDCPICLTCEECYVNNGWHCLGCGECYFYSEEELCGYCWFCADCMGGLCDGCGFCEGCWELELMHCTECGNCYGATEECAFGFDHCEECCVICEQCEECLYEDGIELCDDCGLCVFCCQDNAEAQGCSCREYCVESSDWYDHLCPDCGNAFCEVDVCDTCGLCLDCCEGNSECSDTPPVCVEDGDYDFHFCEDCGDCFHSSDPCEDCEAAGALLCKNCCKLRLEEEGCDCDDRCINDADIENHIASAHKNAGGSHSANPQSTWDMNETHHWRNCRYCDSASHISSKAAHVCDKYGVCTVCAYDSQKTILILKQPQSLVAKVTDHLIEDKTDPTYPDNNRISFTVAAKGTSALSFQWYEQISGRKWVALKDQPDAFTAYIKGAKTNTLTLTVPVDACYESYAYRCVITDKKGNKVTSNTAYLKARHIYKKHVAQKGALTDTIHQSGTGNNIGVYASDGHYSGCVGDGCEEQKLQPHSYSKQTRVIADRKTGVKWVERICIHCSFKNYILDHDHYFYDPETYECEVDTSYKDEDQHRLKCLWPGCDKTTLEAHDKMGWQNHGTPYSTSDKVGLPYQECQICGYSSTKKLQTYNASKDKMVDTKWTQSNDLVYVEGGYASCDVVVNGTKLTIGFAPSAYYKQEILKRQNPKITGWKVRYYCNRTPSGSVIDQDVTKDFKFTKVGNELKWTLTVPLFSNRKGGGILTFTPVIAAGECKHTGGTRIKGKVDPICTFDGYTGDKVCADCEGVIKYGEIIEGGDKHTGKLTLIAGTAKKGTCEQRGYEGTYRCDHCKKTVRGKSTAKVHSGKTTLKNAVAVTCTKFGYSGDLYCSCGVLLKEGEILAPRHTNLKLINAKKANCQTKGYTGDWKCFACNQITKYGYNLPKGDHAWSKWGKINDVYHRHTCTVAGCGAQETARHIDGNRDLTCDSCGYGWGSDSPTIRSLTFNIDIPVIGKKPDYTMFDGKSYYSDGRSAYQKNGVEWYDVTASKRFVPGGVGQEYKEGHVYKVTIHFRSKVGYDFVEEEAMLATINGREAVVEYSSNGDHAGISYTFEALKHEHIMERVNKVSATCTKAGKNTYYHCSSCDKNYEDAAGKQQISDLSSWGIVKAKGHKPSELKSNSTHHYKVCTVCYEEIAGSKAAHSGGTASCVDKAKCKDCGVSYGELADHSLATEVWGFFDAVGHAHVCKVQGCGYRSEVIPHRSSGAATDDTDEVCLDCGYVITLAANHTHTPVAGYQYDEEGHWSICGCGEIMEKEEHVDKDKNKECDVCGCIITGELKSDKGGSGALTVIIIVLVACLMAAGGAAAAFIILKKKKRGTVNDEEEVPVDNEADEEIDMPSDDSGADM